jgi:DNA-binding CsgD family transcriptional regulator
MFDLTSTTATRSGASADLATVNPLAGAELDRCMPWLAAVLDEIDYGLVLLDGDAHVVHLNQAARIELGGTHPLQRQGGEIRARRPHDESVLADAFDAARRGLRRKLVLGDTGHRANVALVPLAGPNGAGSATLLMLSKREVCETLSVEGFARCHRLTGAETRVLIELCRGTPPGEIANELGVAVSTVRTQIGNVRLKTGAASIRALVRQVAVLPPLVSVLRHAASALQGRPS